MNRRRQKLIYCVWFAAVVLAMKSDLLAWWWTGPCYYVSNNGCGDVYACDFTNEEAFETSCHDMQTGVCPAKCGDDEGMLYVDFECHDNGGDPPNYGTCYCATSTCDEGCDCEDPECQDPECPGQCAEVGEYCESVNECCGQLGYGCWDNTCCVSDGNGCNDDGECCGAGWLGGGARCIDGSCGQCVDDYSEEECTDNDDCCYAFAGSFCWLDHHCYPG